MKIFNILKIIGEYSIFTSKTLKTLNFINKRKYIFINQLKKIGYDSILLIVVTSAFTGLVSALQASYQTKGYIPTNLISVMIAKSSMIELSPVLTALVLAGKVGATISAEIGSMKVSEQIDALKSMAIDPYEYLYMPKLLASIVMLPTLTLISMFISIISAFIFSKQVFHITAYTFFMNIKVFFEPMDLWVGLIKALCFGFIITSIANYSGSISKNGAEGVGISTTNTVVYSSIGILMTDFLIAHLIFGGLV
ncbi:MAG: ABC transporter permease [Candidatus Cloacimonetes bacterium]|jgi:phospholipid/cholesterol/gamma-HCH transport system permease protein|nr:ABC transporter permease [Candidatus Cloacimonadota bacterium]MDD4155686.1 ABC transporter permease [Candidatus Cloacimonadota bacterium]